MGKKRPRDQEAGDETNRHQENVDLDEAGSDFEVGCFPIGRWTESFFDLTCSNPCVQDFDTVDVDFEWFNFDANVDFKGIRALLRQLFDVDNELIDMSALSDLVIAQNTIGSTVKVDSKENDPYCFLTVLNLKDHQETECVKSLVKYITTKANSVASLRSIPQALENNHVGVVLSERFINMPAQIAPPLYSMLQEELSDAVEDNEPYDFSHFLIISKTYHEVESAIDQGERNKKKSKINSALFYFHPEDEVMQRFASAWGNYTFSGEAKSASDSKRAFQEAGIKTMGFMMLVETSKFKEAVKAIGEYMESNESS